tara:strand:+ start:15242 stop:17233 length:1992 start_codon:yes stop_codon:yes gene_type:complete
MSRINIQGTIDNIKSKSNVYTPIIEAIVNSIQSIINSEILNGKIEIILQRDKVLDLNTIPEITSITIRDNGIGFTKENRDSFDTFYSEYKKEVGGKGFGRFMFIKYFEKVSVSSVFYENPDNKLRTFNFGKKYEIIENEEINDTSINNTYSELKLENLKEKHSFDKQIETISKRLLEKLLIFFINDSFNCPLIIVREEFGNEKIVLNDYLSGKNEIQLYDEFQFDLENSESKAKIELKGKIFKIYFPGNQKSKISLTGHNREVTDTNLHKYVSEFEDDFYDENPNTNVRKNFIIKTYILGDYLDENVSLERETFDFGKEKSDMYYPFSQKDIEIKAAELTKKAFNDDVRTRADKKKQKVRNYVNENAPWHRTILNELDISTLPYNASNQEIEISLQNLKYQKESNTRAKFREMLDSPDEVSDIEVQEAIAEISEIGKNDLAHYVFNRKCILEAFKRLLTRRDDGKGNLEEEVHNLIYPMRKNSEDLNYEDHNLWLLDERLVFSEFISSDQKISAKNGALGEPDLVVFDQKQSFRNGDNEFSNPLTIFEFKRPKRKNYKEEDDPILQIGRYLKDIRLGKYEMPEGLEQIKVNENTPIYGYVIADLTEKIREFADKHQLTESADKEGYFGFHRGYKMYVEIISFKKLFKDAELRNRIFFKKLQLE